ncbi:MAG: antA/AntB antirepressor family protein [Methylicorpusculum sp.]|uniref:antA/AntB antirepressor family protein n=1 Tax=Methylicorpusculum sp. TaxID=2713644 RepID=UPI00273190DF|nr:antA/AntB antirepressor family protein [Methylicorpusculum sp.]MDP2203901.1 antA/AntB antirepressor family protein [Methylicorpusculum sp.]
MKTINKSKDNSAPVPVFSVKLRGIVVWSVSARDLHAALKLKGRPTYEEWINAKIVTHRLIEGRDYVFSRIRIGQGRWLNDYFVTLSMAQGLCLSEGYWSGGAVRKALMETEITINRKHYMHHKNQAKQAEVHMLMEHRSLYWSHIKLEMLLATGSTCASGELHANVLIAAQLLQDELSHDLRTELLSGKISYKDQRQFIEHWKPAFTLALES